MIKKIFAITLIFILAAGCNKKDDSTGPTVTNDQNLVATWDLGSMKVNGAAANQNNFEGIPIKIIFNSNGTGTAQLSDYGGAAYNVTFTWSSTGNQLNIQPAGQNPVVGTYTISVNSLIFSFVEGTDTMEFTFTKTGAAGGATVMGTLTLPAAANGNTWLVIIDDNFTPDDGYNYMTSGVAGTTTSINYSINNVSAGTYLIYAAICQSAGCPNGPQSGDFVGIYGGTYSNPPTQANATVPASGTVTFNITVEIIP